MVKSNASVGLIVSLSAEEKLIKKSFLIFIKKYDIIYMKGKESDKHESLSIPYKPFPLKKTVTAILRFAWGAGGRKFEPSLPRLLRE